MKMMKMRRCMQGFRKNISRNVVHSILVLIFLVTTSDDHMEWLVDIEITRGRDSFPFSKILLLAVVYSLLLAGEFKGHY